MNSVIIFIPSCLSKENSCKLVGLMHQYPQKCINTFYILNAPQNGSVSSDEGLLTIGEYNKQCQFSKTLKTGIHNNWVFLGMKCNEFVLHKVIIDGKDINLFLSRKAILIVYDYDLFLHSELLFSTNYYNETVHYGNCFETLVNQIKCRKIEPLQSSDKKEHLIKGINWAVRGVMYLANIMLLVFTFLQPVLKYSSLCLHVHNSLESLCWALNSVTSKRKVTLKVGNYVVAFIVDIFLGMFVLHWLMASLSALPSQLLINAAEVVVDTLQELLKWLMGIPAGLKLNFAFNNMLGKFFLYHINLWWTFLVLARPVLDFMFNIFLCFGRLGLTFQAAILGDLLALASFHVYCIYVYAARLYNLQVSGLIALWRLFRGRKYNPLRGRVDSCQYTANQLFIGTLAFTILLFLLPTTAMYYVVFTTLRLLVAGLAGLLTRIQLLLQMLPLYVTGLWFMRSTLISTSLYVQVQKTLPGEHFTLSANPVPGSLLTVVQCCVPEPVNALPKVFLGTLLKSMATGQLIYPV